MAKGTTSTPHDAVFKQFLRQADTARDFLAIHLPPALRQRCDLDTYSWNGKLYRGGPARLVL
jgi:hypothetical protein